MEIWTRQRLRRIFYELFGRDSWLSHQLSHSIFAYLVARRDVFDNQTVQTAAKDAGLCQWPLALLPASPAVEGTAQPPLHCSFTQTRETKGRLSTVCHSIIPRHHPTGSFLMLFILFTEETIKVYIAQSYQIFLWQNKTSHIDCTYQPYGMLIVS